MSRDDVPKSPGKPPQPAKAAAEATDPPGRRERQRLATRERIYQSAIEEFERAGFASAQIDRIVEKAGVARGTFYFHFPTKEHVLIELQHRTQDRYVAELAAMGPAPQSIAEFFLQIYDMVGAARSEQPNLVREMLAMHARANTGTTFTDESLIVHIVDYLSAAAERGAVRLDIPPEALAIHFLTAMFLHFTSTTDAEQAREFVLAKIDILVKGMQP